MKKKVFGLMVILLPVLNQAQSKKAVNPLPLTIGERVPISVWNTLLQTPVSDVRASSLSNKMVLLDFFATTCGTCIQQLPKLQQLQSQYRHRLQVLVVTNEPPATIRQFLQKFPQSNLPDLAFVQASKALLQYFPYRIIPHLVWIGANQQVAAITDAAALTAAQIDGWLAGNPLLLPVKKDLLDFEPRIPFAHNNYLLSAAGYRSFFTGYLPGTVSMHSKQRLPDSLHERDYCINYPIVDLYLSALGRQFGPNRVIIEGADSSAFFPLQERYEQWLEKHAYSYEIIYPHQTAAKTKTAIIMADLNSRLSLNARIENREMNCWAIRASDATVPLLQKALAQSGDSASMRLHKMPLPALLYAFNRSTLQNPQSPIFLDETGLSGKYRFAIPITYPIDVAQVAQTLAWYGLSIVTTKKLLPMLVISRQ